MKYQISRYPRSIPQLPPPPPLSNTLRPGPATKRRSPGT